MKGRKPTPLALKVLRGNPGRRPLPDSEPAFENIIPKCPIDLDKIGKKTWKEKSKLLHAAGVLTTADGQTLALYCQIWSQIVMLSKELSTVADYMAYDVKINESTGEEIRVNAKVNPLVIRLEALYAEYRSYSALLALDPANRGKIKVDKKPEKKKDCMFD